MLYFMKTKLERIIMNKEKIKFHVMKLLPVYLMITFALVMSGCNTEDNPITPGASTYLMVVHASPDAPNLDIYVGSTLIASNVPYLNVVPYKALTPGNNRVRMYTTGSSSVPFIDTTIFLQQDMYSTVFAADSAIDMTPVVTSDNLTSPGSTNSNIRFVHLSPNTQTLDAGAAGKSVWLPIVSFLGYDDFRAVTAGTYNLQLMISLTPTIVATLNNQTLTAGSIYTMVAVGFSGATGNQALGIKLIQNK